MSIKYTKGPWEAILSKPSRRGIDGTAMVRAGGTMAIDCTNSGDSWEEVEGNCKLIAALPDLVEALRKISAMNDTSAAHVARAALDAAKLKR